MGSLEPSFLLRQSGDAIATDRPLLAEDVGVLATRLTGRLAQLTGARAVYVPAPGLVSSPATRQALVSDPALATVEEAWQQLSVLLWSRRRRWSGDRRLRCDRGRHPLTRTTRRGSPPTTASCSPTCEKPSWPGRHSPARPPAERSGRWPGLLAAFISHGCRRPSSVFSGPPARGSSFSPGPAPTPGSRRVAPPLAGAVPRLGTGALTGARGAHSM
jgi:hypothetical protein